LLDEYLKQQRQVEHERRVKREKREMLITGLVLLAAAIVAAALLWASNVHAAAETELTHKGKAWVVSAGRAFAAITRRESPKHWYDCGELTPAGEWNARGERIAEAALLAMKHHGLHVDPMGLLAVAWNESRGNACSIGPRTRARAEKMGLLPVGKTWREYTRADVLAVLDNPKWKERGNVADVGVWQDVYPPYARILDDSGDLTCLRPKNVRCRIPRTHELVTVETSAEVGVHGMLVRYFHFRTREPWLYWPWTIRDSYSRAVEATIKALNDEMKKGRT